MEDRKAEKYYSSNLEPPRFPRQGGREGNERRNICVFLACYCIYLQMFKDGLLATFHPGSVF